jgi:hypothetical protein
MMLRRAQPVSHLLWLRPACKVALGLLLAAITVVLVEEVQVRNLVGWTSESAVTREPAYAMPPYFRCIDCYFSIFSEGQAVDVMLAMAAVAFPVGIVIKRRLRRKQRASSQ